nr:hypothetical protein [Tanacetum cinerariifolium]
MYQKSTRSNSRTKLRRKILGISPRVPNEDFIVPPSKESMITLLYELGYKGEDFQEYGRAIPCTMLTDDIKQSEAYKAFIGYSTHSILPKKTKGKWSKGNKQAITLKKKGLISANDNKPVSEEASKGKPANRPTRRRRPSGVSFRDTSRVSTKKSLDMFEKLKEIIHTSLTQEKKLVLHKGSYESTDKLTTSSKGASITPEVLDEAKGSLAAKGIPTASDEFPLPEDFPTASEERFPLLRKRDATAEDVCTANEDKGYSWSKTHL